MAKDQSIKKVYIIGQNYSFGHQVTPRGEGLPEAQAPGHPDRRRRPASDRARSRTSRPYIAKIKASGADTVVTGNWGADLALLIKAAKDADLKADFYTYYASTTGVPTAMGAAGADRVKYVGVLERQQ